MKTLVGSLLCLNCSHTRYCFIFPTKIPSHSKTLKCLFPFCFMHYFNISSSTFLISFFPLLFLIYQGDFSSFSAFVFALSPGIDRTNEHSTLCISLILNPGHFKSAMCSQGSQLSSQLLLTWLPFFFFLSLV